MKIIITGATGWLGRNSIRFFLNSGLNLENLILIGSHKRDIEIFDGVRVSVKTFDEVINSTGLFNFYGVVHLAYLTRDKISNNINEYVNENSKITNQVMQILKLKPKWFTYVSSGAIYSNYLNQTLESDSKSNPYGYLKHQDELKFDQYCSDNSINISIGRLWGASGKDFINPSKYAFGEFILNSLANEDITIESPRAVFRKYCDSEQFMEICIKTAQTWPRTIFNSSGELFEIEDLAKLVAKTLNSKIKVSRKYFEANIVPDDYYSRDEDFIRLAKLLDIKLLDTKEQILKTSDYLKLSVNHLT